MGMGRRGASFLEDGRECRLLGFMYADDLVFRGESEGDLRSMLGRFVQLKGKFSVFLHFLKL